MRIRHVSPQYFRVKVVDIFRFLHQQSTWQWGSSLAQTHGSWPRKTGESDRPLVRNIAVSIRKFSMMFSCWTLSLTYDVFTQNTLTWGKFLLYCITDLPCLHKTRLPEINAFHNSDVSCGHLLLLMCQPEIYWFLTQSGLFKLWLAH